MTTLAPIDSATEAHPHLSPHHPDQPAHQPTHPSQPQSTLHTLFSSTPFAGTVYATTNTQTGNQQNHGSNSHANVGPSAGNDTDDTNNRGDGDDDSNHSATQTRQTAPKLANFVQALLECLNDSSVNSINWDNEGAHVVITNGEDAAQAVRNAYRGSFKYKDKRATWTKLAAQLASYCFERAGQAITSRPDLATKFKHPSFKRDSPEHYQFVSCKLPPNTPANDDSGDDSTIHTAQTRQTDPKLTNFVQALLECANDSSVNSINWDNEGTHVVFTDGEDAAQAVRNAYRGSRDFTGSLPTWRTLIAQLRSFHFERLGQTATPRPGLPVKYKHDCFKRDAPQLYPFVLQKQAKKSRSRLPTTSTQSCSSSTATQSHARRGTALLTPNTHDESSEADEPPVTTRRSRGTIRTRPTRSVPVNFTGSDEVADHYDHVDEASNDLQHVAHKQRLGWPARSAAAFVQLTPTTSTPRQGQRQQRRQTHPPQQSQQPQPYQPFHHQHQHLHHQEQHQQPHDHQITHNLTQAAQTLQTVSTSFNRSIDVFQTSADTEDQNSLLFSVVSADLRQSAATLRDLHFTLLEQAQQLTTPSYDPLSTMDDALSDSSQMQQQHHQQQNQLDLTQAAASNISAVVQALDTLTQSLSASLHMLRTPSNLHQQQEQHQPEPTSQLLPINLSNSITMLWLARSSLSQQVQRLSTHHYDH